MKRLFLTVWLLGLFCLPALCAGQTAGKYQGKRVFYINSYHPGYEWSDGEERGAQDVLEPLGVAFKVFHLDSKRRQDPKVIEAAARSAMAEIQSFKPDVVIAADDNAQAYVVVPYLKNGPVPVVFCGVNWDATPYAYAGSNVTGMVEVEPFQTLASHLLRFAKGKRLGLVTDDTESERKSVQSYERLYTQGQLKSFFVKDFEAFKASVADLGNDVDGLIILNNASIRGWDVTQAAEYLARTLRIPSGTLNEWMAPYVAFSVAKVPEEQGEWAARTALRIMDGERPATIPPVRNVKARLIINLKMASAAGIVPPVSMLRAAQQIIGAEAVRNGTPAPQEVGKPGAKTP